MIAEWTVERPLRLGLVVGIGVLVGVLARRSIDRLGGRILARGTEADERQEQERTPGQAAIDDGLLARRNRRTETLTSVLRSLVTGITWTIVGLLVLGEVGISLGPLIAGAGIVGVVLAFGAQHIVADFLAGSFMLFEDQFGVGDVIDVGDAAGTVEKVSLRVTTLRDVNGTVWHVPNSHIERVANKSQLWSRAVLDIDVAYDTDLRRAEGIIQRVADQLWQDTEFTAGDIIDPPEVWGVENLGADGVTIRLVVKTDPAEQWAIGRELRLRIKEALDEAGIEIPFPQRVVWLRHDQGALPRADRPQVDLAPLRQRNSDEHIPE